MNQFAQQKVGDPEAVCYRAGEGRNRVDEAHDGIMTAGNERQDMSVDVAAKLSSGEVRWCGLVEAVGVGCDVTEQIRQMDR